MKALHGHPLAVVHHSPGGLAHGSIRITSRWPEREAAAIAATTDAATRAAYRDCAQADLDELLDSRYVLAVMDDPRHDYRGTFTEIGAALATRRHVIILSPPSWEGGPWGEGGASPPTNVFFWHPDIRRHVVPHGADDATLLRAALDAIAPGAPS
jgi:hypothetical protein